MNRLIVLLLLALTFNAFANTPNLIWCNSCTPAQMQAAAAKVGLGVTYVGDPINRIVNAYQTYWDVEDTNPPTRTKVTDQIASNSQLMDNLDTAINFYNLKPVGWHKHFDSRINDTWPSVYNIINSGRYQNDFINSINGFAIISADTVSLFGNVVQTLASIHLVDQSAGPTLRTTLEFSDGSHVDAVFDPSTDKLILDPSTARDSHNNSIPYLGSDGLTHSLGGEHDFSGNGNPNDENNFLNQVNHLGVVIISGVGGSSSQQHGWACVKSGDGPDAVYTCKYY